MINFKKIGNEVKHRNCSYKRYIMAPKEKQKTNEAPNDAVQWLILSEILNY